MKDRVLRLFDNQSPQPDAFVLANSTDPHLDGSFFYLFDVPSGLFEGSVAIAHPDGKVDLLSSPLEQESAEQAAKADPAVEVHVWTNPKGKEATLQKLIPARGNIALNFRELTHDWFVSLEKMLPHAHWVDGSEAVRRTRMIKDAAEIERLERAAAIGSEVGREIPSLLKTGLTELGLATEIEHRMMQHGASGRSFGTIVGFDVKGAEPHYAPQERPLKPGSSIVCDFGAYYRRYASDITRSFRFGPTDPELKKVHETVFAAQEAALALVRPGVSSKDVHLAAQKVVDDSPWKGRFTHGLGHSIGLAVHDGFSLNPTNDEPLEVGMAVTIEPGIYLPGKGGVRIEDDILVTKNGYRMLTNAPREYLEVRA
ncbi:MAG: Xaa-Pro peptidase family protein [Thermoplasmata archaeon]|nr:Xaa-Pro peptidase family protein [Thermoplasmata archaeon]